MSGGSADIGGRITRDVPGRPSDETVDKLLATAESLVSAATAAVQPGAISTSELERLVRRANGVALDLERLARQDESLDPIRTELSERVASLERAIQEKPRPVPLGIPIASESSHSRTTTPDAESSATTARRQTTPSPDGESHKSSRLGRPSGVPVAERLGATSRERYEVLDAVGARALSLVKEQDQFQARADEIGEQLRLFFAEARRRYGITWAQIGSLMGVSRELAYHRYGKRTTAEPRRRSRSTTTRSDRRDR